MVIQELINMMCTANYEGTRFRAAITLSMIGINNEDVINSLIQHLETTKEQYTRLLITGCLSKIAVNNQNVISILIDILNNTQLIDVRNCVIEILKNIAFQDDKTIIALIEIWNSKKAHNDNYYLIQCLSKVTAIDEKDIYKYENNLKDFLDIYYANKYNLKEYVQKPIIDNLAQIQNLINLLINSKNLLYRIKVKEILKYSLNENKYSFWMVSQLSSLITPNTYSSNYEFFCDVFDILYECAENLTYPEFYQAWHGR